MIKISHRKMRKLKKWLPIFSAAALALCVLITWFAGCGKNDGGKVVFTTGLGKNEIFRIGDEICKLPEMMVYLTTTQRQYEDVYGKQIWNTSLNGVTLEESVKDTVLEKVAQIKTMYLLAKSRGISLDETEKAYVKAAAKEYTGRFGETQREEIGITEALMEKLYEEYAMANKVYLDIIQDVNPEISDDEARIVTVQHILIRTSRKDADGNRVEYLTAEKQDAYENACAIWSELKSGKKSFEELASRYSQDTVMTYSFGKGEMDPAFEAAAFQLETDEISPVIESASGYHIIKCISTFDKEETARNKERLLEERRNEAFGEKYDEFVMTLARKLNQAAWDEVGLYSEENLPAADFFEIYEMIFQR